MEPSGFLRGVTKLQLIRCAWISFSFVLLVFALTTSDNFTRKFPDIVARAAGKDTSRTDDTRSVPCVKEVDEAEGEHQSQMDFGSHSETVLGSRVDYTAWDTRVGCGNFKKKYSYGNRTSSTLRSLQNPTVDNCTILRKQHVSVLVKKWTWIPDTLNNLYSCDCGLTCLWTNSDVLLDRPDAHLYESATPPSRRRKGEPWRIYMDLEPGRNRAPSQDLFVSYHANDDLQVTYAGAAFHTIRNYYISPVKHDDVLVYWSSSRCVESRQRIASEVLGFLPHHSFGKCLNNVGGMDVILEMYPKCSSGSGAGNVWNQNLHCAMSHYKFVLAIENSQIESYATEKLYYALDAGAVPIYFGAPNVEDFVPPHSIIQGRNFATIQGLAEYVKKVAADPVLYAEYHAWRRCGVLGVYGRTRAVSLDSLPCRLCAAVSSRGGRNSV
uniref:Fucosyltransferase n=1 Tax=Physcomitrium patens TaxID=3218 RepID=Q5TJK3_PHYPA|nr:alpha-1,4-fucosyltransferase [Physcomitrium patens]